MAKEGITLRRAPLRTLQINLGRVCNQSCRHCHVEAGPNRTELMSQETADDVLRFLAGTPSIDTLDITGGAPELNPEFRRLVTEARKMGKQVMDRCNLTILFEPGMEDLAGFLAENQVHVVASLPCYGPDNVEKQRGKGVFDLSIRGLQRLNALGYAKDPELEARPWSTTPGGVFATAPGRARDRLQESAVGQFWHCL